MIRRRLRRQLLLITGLSAGLMLPAGATGTKFSVHHPVQGRWVAGPIPLNHGNSIGVSPWCRLYTRNLNQFRSLPFDACSPRLSKKYPEFVRLHWTRIPWDRALARAVVTSTAGPYPASFYKKTWREWLQDTRALRQSGRVHLWRTSVDLLGNGEHETLIRLDHVPFKQIVIRGGRAVNRFPYCGYVDSQLYVMPYPNPALAKAFNKSAAFYGDVLYDTKTKSYVFLDWQRYPLPTRFFRKATDAVIASFYSGVGGSLVHTCYINWIPALPPPTTLPTEIPTHPSH